MNIPMALRLLYALGKLRQHEHWTRAKLLAYQGDALGALRAHTYARSPFYQWFHKGFFDRPLMELPVLTKAMLMEHFDELVTDRSLKLDDARAYATRGEAGAPYRNRYWVTATSGSSGQPGFFLFDQKEWIHILASFARSQEWSGVKIDLTQRQKMATVASVSPWHMSSQVAASVKSWWRPSLRLAASQPLAQIIEQLNGWQPDALIAYASMIGSLAEEQLAGRLHISPSIVYTSSEVLTTKARQLADKAWGNEPYNQYAATETANLAAEHKACRHLHIYEDMLILEVVDEHNQPVPAGEYGTKVLATTLFSRTQPLIRYELNDRIRLSPQADPCGLPFAVLGGIEGRAEDALEMPGAAGGRVKVQPLAFNRIMDILPVGRWQVIQQADDGLIVLLGGEGGGMAAEEISIQLIRSLAEEGAAVPYIHIQHVAEIPKSGSGKAPLIQAYKASRS